MIFTDSEGRKYKEVELRGEHTFVIKPIVEKPEYRITVWNSTSGTFEITVIVKANLDQAQLIKEAIKELMEFIHSDNEFVNLGPANEARNAIQKGQDE